MQNDHHHHRSEAKIGFIKSRFLVAKALACVLEADVTRAELEQHLLKAQDHAPSSFEHLYETVSHRYGIIAQSLNDLASALSACEEVFNEDEDEDVVAF